MFGIFPFPTLDFKDHFISLPAPPTSLFPLPQSRQINAYYFIYKEQGKNFVAQVQKVFGVCDLIIVYHLDPFLLVIDLKWRAKIFIN